MRIYDVVKFDPAERDTFKRAYRWCSISAPFSEEEKLAISRVVDNNPLNRGQVLQVETAWRRIRDEMEQRWHYWMETAEKPMEASQASRAVQEGMVPLYVNAPQLGRDFAANLTAGIAEVNALLLILTTARLAMHDEPDQEWLESAEYGESSVEAVFVRR